MKKIALIVFSLLLIAVNAAYTQSLTIPSQWKLILEDDPSFKLATIDESKWLSVTVPNGWTRLGINKEKIIGWYRVHVNIPDELLNKDLILLAGTIDDADETYFNGEWVGSSGKFPPGDQTAWDAERKYVIKKNLVKKNNTIAIRVYNGIGDGGIYSGRVMLMSKKDYDRQVAAQIKNKKSYYQLTTSNGLIAAVYNEQTQTVENLYPHIFSYYDSALLVKPVLSNLKPVTKEKPLRTKYLQNTHVIEVKYSSYSLYYFSSFVNESKIFYIAARGNNADIDKLNFVFDNGYGRIQTTSFAKKYNGSYEKYFLFGFTDSLHFESDAVFKATSVLNSRPTSLIDAELQYMKKVFASCKFPIAITQEERKLMEQSIAVLKMSQVSENEIFLLSKGQVLASLRPGVWAISWVRDAAFAIEAMSKTGMYDEAKKALEFMLNAKPTNQFINYIHTDKKNYGLGVPYIISVTRYFGNGREESDFGSDNGPNIEIDDLGLFLTAFYHYVNESGDKTFFEKWKNEIAVIGNAIIHNINEKNIIRRESGPWEHHLPGKEFMWTSGTCARGLQLISSLQKKYNFPNEEFEKASQLLYTGIMSNCLIAEKFIKGNATEQDSADHYYFDAATFELFANGLISNKKLFATHMQEYDKHNRAANDSNKGYIRFNSSDSYENQEWPFAGLRVAVAQKKLGSSAEAKKLIDRITVYANRNHNLVPEILSNEMSLYKGAIPMVGYGSGAYILALWEYYRNINQ